MRKYMNLKLVLLLVCVGCGKGNAVIPPVGGGLSETQIQETKVDSTPETFTRPVEEGSASK